MNPALSRDRSSLRYTALCTCEVSPRACVHALAAERDWYRSEALRLDTFCSSLKADVEYMREKVTVLEDDRSEGAP